MTERLPCKTDGCKATILPATAAETGGICMPCHQAQERQKRQAYFEKHRKTVNVYENLSDPVEILKVMHVPRKHDPLIQYVRYPVSKEQLYVSLTTDEAGRMLKHALELLAEGDEEQAEAILSSLVCYRNENIAAALPELMEQGMYNPALVYKDASPAVRDRLLEQVEWDDENRNLLLLALSWIGDPLVVRRFQEWRLHPPAWADQLFVQPEIYALEGGWELTQEGERRDLTHSLSYAIRVTSEQTHSEDEVSAARFLTTSTSTCPWCEGSLTILMDVEAAHPSLAYLALSLERLKIQTCERCGCFSTIYMDVDSQGVPVWSRFNHKPDYLRSIDPDDYSGVSDYRLTLSTEPHSPFFAAIWTLSQQNSQIGGHPSWVQDADYPSCPCCGKRMRFIGQIDWADFVPLGEGIFYMFVCPEDKMTATLYQQS
ncbi:DUF1963 domain-containing protein [Brevibacillus nitrificans]|uniref:DUF1963 domain-containing protein n=1 Tax=Brevibacillus nitrificans TaxID=651560 RepID=UPI00285C3A8F|nr:DUF1963 domain-containing protein [Brevibacillus nitrificans]MDR7315496.1 AcrR family transcriptional regulator [Brevibacillus nitrificans]